MNASQLAAVIRDVPDFPQPGILFKDITPILADARLLKAATELMAHRHVGEAIDKVAAVEARGFIFGVAVAQYLDAGFVPIRKKGKLPYETIEASYELEYGAATLAMHTDAVDEGEQVLIIDDLLATGGTAAAAVSLVEQLGGVVRAVDFLIELEFLNGREKLAGHDVFAHIQC